MMQSRPYMMKTQCQPTYVCLCILMTLKNEEYKVNHVIMGWARVQDKIKLYMQK